MKKLAAFFLSPCAIGSAFGADQVVKVAVNEAANSYKPAMTALYKEVGLVAEFVMLPSERALKSVESGEVDADFGRVVGGTAGYQNMIELTESLSEITLLAVVKKGSPITGVTPADLKSRKVGLLRGTKMAEGLMAKVGAEATPVNTNQQLYQMLTNDRFEVALTTSTLPVPPDLAGGVTVLGAPVAVAKVVHVLGKKWSTYGPKLDAALKAMKADGRWAKLLPNAK